MRILSVLLALLAPALARADAFPPSIPPAQTTEAAISYAVASVLMILTLAAAGWMARKR